MINRGASTNSSRGWVLGRNSSRGVGSSKGQVYWNFHTDKQNKSGGGGKPLPLGSATD